MKRKERPQRWIVILVLAFLGLTAVLVVVLGIPRGGPLGAIPSLASGTGGEPATVVAGTVVPATTPARAAVPVPTGQEGAIRALVAFFESLSAGRYEAAAQFYGGSYDLLIDHNPGLDPMDHAALLENACTVQGFRCLEVWSAHLQERRASSGEYRFVVQFTTADGELFVRGPCCGARETEMPPQSEFPFTVVKGADGNYRILELPVYVP